jgi:ribosomal protein RSM22 (predicted rRNA methylase)
LQELPPSIAREIDTLVDRHEWGQLAATAARLSAAYRVQGQSVSRVARTAEDVAAYLAYRAPATFAATATVFGHVRRQRPDWQPRAVVDVGAGPGVASWAAVAAWPEIERLTLVEVEPEMVAAGRAIAAAAPVRALAEASWVQGDATSEVEEADLVVASYVLGELDEHRRGGIVDHLWSATTDTIIFVEPGTPAGYARVIATRAALVTAGGFTVAPCPHDATCPLVGDDWCHFAARLPRGDAHRSVKRVSRGFEDEKFSYAALSRARGNQVEARIIRPPLIRSGHVYLDTCEVDGIGRRIVARRDADAYRAARKAAWGDGLATGHP